MQKGIPQGTEKDFLSFISHLPTMAHAIDKDGLLVNVSQVWLEKMGYTKDEVIGRSSMDFLTDESRRFAVEKALPEFFRNNYIENVPYKFVAKDKSTIDVLLSARGISDEKGSFLYSLATLTDITEKLATEKSLASSDSKFKKYFETNISATFVWQVTDDDFTLIEVNDAANILTENKANDFIGSKAKDIYKDLPMMVEQLQSCLKNKSIIDIEHHYKNRGTGKYDWINFRFAYAEPDLIILYADNITDRKKSEETKNRILEASIGGIYIFDLRQGKNSYVNNQYFELTGYNIDDINSMSQDEFISLFHPEDQSLVHIHIDNLINNLPDGKNLNIDYRFKHANGMWRWYRSCDAVYERDDNGNVLKFIGTFIDITAHKQSEILLKKSEEQYRHLFENLYDVYYRTDSNGVIKIVSPSVEKILGYSPDELVGRQMKDLYLKPEDRDSFLSMLNRNGYAENFSAQIKGKDNKIVWFSSNAKLIKDSDGNVEGVEGISRDITAHKKSEDHTRQSQKMQAIGNLAGGIAHDFNNILQSILGFTELSIKEVPKGSGVENNLKDVLEGCYRAKELIYQILTFARKSEEENRPISFGSIVDEVVNFIRSSIPTNIEISKNIESDSFVLANQSQLYQVVLNICTNASQAMEQEGGKLMVSLIDTFIDKEESKIYGLVSGKYVKLTVSDTGVGIPPEIINSIFDPYFTTKGITEGTGLGLSVAHGIIESFNGKIFAKSELGNGTVFTVFLPITQRAYNKIEKEAEYIPLGNESILFVDDEAMLVKLGCRILEKLGYEVTPLTNSQEALNLFKSHPDKYDLVITDMAMPGLTGDKLAIELIKVKHDIPVILWTGYSKTVSEEVTQDIGIKAFLSKPLVKSELAQAVRKVLDEAK